MLETEWLMYLPCLQSGVEWRGGVRLELSTQDLTTQDPIKQDLTTQDLKTQDSHYSLCFHNLLGSLHSDFPD